jgi:hypothetical protein
VTEEEWLAGEDWRLMVAFLAGRWTGRKARLYVCAGLRCLWDQLYDDSSRGAVEAAEREADGIASDKELRWARYSAECPTFGFDFRAEDVRHLQTELGGHHQGVRRLMAMGVYTEDELKGNGDLGEERVRLRLRNAAHIAYHALDPFNDGSLEEHLLQHLCEQEEWPQGWLMQELFGNPFRPATVHAAWLAWHGGAIPKLAEAVYEEWALPSGHLDPARLAVLADMLEEAGVTDAGLLGHLRGPGPHGRGCFAIDVLTGRS